MNLATGTAKDTFGNTDTLISIENAIGTALSDTITAATTGSTIVGGGGGDLLKAGSGPDTFVYLTIADSKPGTGTFDTIQNFTHGQDKIDFTNIAGINASGGVPTFEGNISGAGNHTLNAHSVAFMEVGGNTLVLVNTTNSAETVSNASVSAANMEIVLTGVSLGLTASDFHHI